MEIPEDWPPFDSRRETSLFQAEGSLKVEKIQDESEAITMAGKNELVEFLEEFIEKGCEILEVPSPFEEDLEEET